MEIRKHPALPIILIKEDGKTYKVDWDYQEAPESKILTSNETYLRGYLYGVVAGMGIENKKLHDSFALLSGRTGTIAGLDESTANRLAEILKNVLHPMVAQEHKRLRNEAKLPHLMFVKGRERDRSE